MKDKKWKLAVWGLILGSAVTLASIIGWFASVDGTAGILAQGLGIFILIFGAYNTANVAQKNVISKNYHPELDERSINSEEKI